MKQSPMDIIEQSCLYYGASLRGRKDGSKHIIGTSHKAPIAVEPTNEIFFFQRSPQRILNVYGYRIYIFVIMSMFKVEKHALLFQTGRASSYVFPIIHL